MDDREKGDFGDALQGAEGSLAHLRFPRKRDLEGLMGERRGGPRGPSAAERPTSPIPLT